MLALACSAVYLLLIARPRRFRARAPVLGEIGDNPPELLENASESPLQRAFPPPRWVPPSAVKAQKRAA
jgi:hypothetical protein